MDTAVYQGWYNFVARFGSLNLLALSMLGRIEGLARFLPANCEKLEAGLLRCTNVSTSRYSV
jgi:hypothetical protein